VLAALIAVVPASWVDDHMAGGARNAVIAGACAATSLAALIACSMLRRSTVRAALVVAGTALAALAIGVVLHLQDRPRRGGLYSVAAERAIAEVAVGAPFVIAVVAICFVLHRHLAAAQRADLAYKSSNLNKIIQN